MRKKSENNLIFMALFVSERSERNGKNNAETTGFLNGFDVAGIFMTNT